MGTTGVVPHSSHSATWSLASLVQRRSSIDMWVDHRRLSGGDWQIPEKEVSVRRSKKGSLFTHVSVMAMNTVPLAAGSLANVLMSMALSAMTASI